MCRRPSHRLLPTHHKLTDRPWPRRLCFDSDGVAASSTSLEWTGTLAEAQQRCSTTRVHAEVWTEDARGRVEVLSLGANLFRCDIVRLSRGAPSPPSPPSPPVPSIPPATGATVVVVSTVACRCRAGDRHVQACHLAGASRGGLLWLLAIAGSAYWRTVCLQTATAIKRATSIWYMFRRSSAPVPVAATANISTTTKSASATVPVGAAAVSGGPCVRARRSHS